MQMFWTVQRIKATSPLGDPRVTYSLEEGLVPETNMPVRFYLTPNRYDGSASILVAELLDYETTKNFLLRVRAQNVAAVPLAAFTTIYINITGVWVLQWSHNLNMYFFFYCFILSSLCSFWCFRCQWQCPILHLIYLWSLSNRGSWYWDICHSGLCHRPWPWTEWWGKQVGIYVLCNEMYSHIASVLNND